MNIEKPVFFQKMLDFLPSTYNSYEDSVRRFGEVLETVIIEDIFMPEIINLLKVNKNITILNKIFEYFEEICVSKDEHLINILSITVLEILGDNNDILDLAKKYLRPKTQQFLIETIKSM